MGGWGLGVVIVRESEFKGESASFHLLGGGGLIEK